MSRLARQYQGLHTQYSERKARLAEVKAEQTRLRAEKTECEGRAGMVANMDLLREVFISFTSVSGQKYAVKTAKQISFQFWT